MSPLLSAVGAKLRRPSGCNVTVPPGTVTVPPTMIAVPLICVTTSALPSMSVSLPRTSISTETSSDVLVLSGLATGPSFTDVTVTVMVRSTVTEPSVTV